LKAADGTLVWSVKNGAANATAAKLCQNEIQTNLGPSFAPGDCLVHKATGNRLIMFPNGTLQLQNAKHDIAWSHPGADGPHPTCSLSDGTFKCISGTKEVDISESSFTALGLTRDLVAGAMLGFQGDGTLAVRFD
jgi:hypothetical protein